MKTYETPVLTVKLFETSDVVTASLIYMHNAPMANTQMQTTYDDLWDEE